MDGVALEPGHHQPGRWAQIVAAGAELHAALADVPAPIWLAGRDDVWAIGDRVAWGELPADRYPGVKHLPELVAALRPVTGRAQVIHGDLTGNVLFHDELPPLVIDLSPYWRPTQFAAAVVAADAVVFEGTGPEVLGVLGHPDGDQYLLRALIFRTVTDHLARPCLRRTEDHDPYLPAVELALSRAGTDTP